MAVNVDYIGESIFDWSDPDRSHSYYDLTRDAEQLLQGDEDLCHRAFGQIRHWPPGAGDEEEGGKTPKSALKKAKDSHMKRNVSWSTKVTCKTYSKDDPNNYDFFNGNVSTNEGMNFDGHADPLFDPHAQNEARVGNLSNGTYYNGGTPPQDQNVSNFQNGERRPRSQPTLAEQFDPYYNTGLDYENQLPDQMYGDSQNQDAHQVSDGSSWEGSEERSYDHSSSRSGTLSHSDNSILERSDNSSLNGQKNRNGNNAEFEDEGENDESSNGRQQSVRSEDVGSEPMSEENSFNNSGSEFNNSGNEFNNSGSDFNNSGSDFHNSGNDFTNSGNDFTNSGSQNYYEGEGFDNMEDVQNWENGDQSRESGSFSEESASSDDYSAGSSEGLLPPVT